MVYEKVISFGGYATMTGDCRCGTDRMVEAVKEVDCDTVLNIQGDESLIKVQMIEELLYALENHEEGMITLKKKFKSVSAEIYEFSKNSLEQAESLEQLPALDNVCKITVIETKYDITGADLSEYIEKVRRI